MNFYDADACQRFFCFRNNVRFLQSSNPSHRVISNARRTLCNLYDDTVKEFNNWSELNPYGYEKREVLYYLDLIRNENFIYESYDGIDGVSFKDSTRTWEVVIRLFEYSNIGDSNWNELVEIYRYGRLIMTCVTPGAYSDGFVFWFLHEENYGLTLYWGKSRLRFRSANEEEESSSGLFSFLKKLF